LTSPRVPVLLASWYSHCDTVRDGTCAKSNGREKNCRRKEPTRAAGNTCCQMYSRQHANKRRHGQGGIATSSYWQFSSLSWIWLHPALECTQRRTALEPKFFCATSRGL